MLNIDLKDVHVQGEIPEGDYTVTCVEAKVRETEKGKFVQSKFRVEGQGTSVYDNFTIEHANPDAVRVGTSRLKTFLKMAGYKNPEFISDVNELCGLSCRAHIKMKSDDWGDKPAITSFKAIKDGAATTPVAAPKSF